MKLLKLSEVKLLEDRQRTEHESGFVQELADSIEATVLINAPVLEQDGVTLKAGYTRFAAISLLASQGKSFIYDGATIEPGYIPCSLLSDLTAAQLFQVELDENVKRVNLSWKDSSRAMAKLYGIYKEVCAENNVQASVHGFSRELHNGEVKKAAGIASALVLAPHLDNPAIAGAKSQKEAEKILRRTNTQLLQKALAERMENFTSPHTLYVGSCFDFAETLPSCAYDLIITDPPFGIGIDTMATQSGSSSGLTHQYKDSFEYAQDCVNLVAEQGFRITKASACCYMFCTIEFYYKWVQIFKQHGWYVWPYPIIWNKHPTGSLLGESNGPRHVYECVLYAIKGNRPVNFVISDVINIPGPSIDKKHPAEKPVELLAEFMRVSATPGDKIIDFFAGCGNIFTAAFTHHCTVDACELDENHATTARLQMIPTGG